MMPSAWFWTVTAFLFGTAIGSFLNVVVYRLPRGQSLNDPQWSYCPNCKNRLTAIDLVPLLSFLALRARCRQCGKPISWRYFGVELLTGLLFVAIALHFQSHAPDAVALALFTAVLVPIYFIDLATFTIPDSLNLLAFAIAIGRDVWGIAAGEANHALLWNWLPRSILGAIVGACIFGAVRVAGWLWKRVEAMGLGDVLLGRAMGAMLISFVPIGLNPLRLFPAWVLFACFSGIVVGPALILLRRRTAAPQTEAAGDASSEAGEIEAGETSSLGRELLEIGWCLALGDAVLYGQDVLRRLRKQPPLAIEDLDDDYVPAPTAIPFGPFLVIGFLATVFFGEWLTAAYLAYALPAAQTNGLPR